MLSHIVLKDFRNYVDLDIKLDNKVNLFIGPNGQGKTNLLESIFFLSMLRSFRTSQIRDIRRIGGNGFYIGAQVKTEAGWSKSLEVEYTSIRKLRIDGSGISLASEFIRQIHAVAFSPEDITIVTGNSGLRRRFIDMLIASLTPRYLTALQNYSIALKSRNSVLRSQKKDVDTLKAYEQILAQNGVEIVKYRQDFLKMLEQEIKELLKGFNKGNVDFSIRYKIQNGVTNQESYLARFETERKKEMFRGQTAFGPQIDDFEILYNKKPLRNYGSTGQCRLISLCMKMAKVNIFASRENDNKPLIVLVDDVTGELDQMTKSYFYQVINKAEQAFFTFTDLPSDKYFDEAKVYKIENGIVIS